MEVIRKRRASTEVEALMAAVKTDYEYFTNAIFESPLSAPKRQRSDASPRYSSRIDDSIAPSKTKHGDRNSWNLRQALSTERIDLGQTTEANLKLRPSSPPSPRFTPPPQLRLGETKSSSRWTKISSPGTTFKRYNSWPPFKTPTHVMSPPPCPSLCPTSGQQHMVSGQDSTEHLEYIFQKTTPQSRELFVETPSGVPFGIPRRHSLDLKDGIEGVLIGQPSYDDNSIKMTTRIIFTKPPSETLVNNTPSNVRSSVGNVQSVRLTTKEKIMKRLMSRMKYDPVKKPSLEEFKSPPKEVSVTVDQTHNSFLQRQSSEAWVRSKPSTNHGSAFVQVNHVDNSSANEKEESSKQRQEEQHQLEISNYQVLPNYVITRVGSLLWLGKDIVYPVTLEEIQRRVKDPENFSFQMLIAYVRHSRAKGRQFLDYWKCQPTGKTAKPNVLSKLCEADTKELVDGIQKVNEEYFPGEKLAQNAAQRFFQDLRKTGNGVGHVMPQELRIQEKVESIEKSRSVFRTLQKALSSSENDEKFDTFNIASHNAGLTNISNNLKFLDEILEKMQSHIKRENINFASFTG